MTYVRLIFVCAHKEVIKHKYPHNNLTEYTYSAIWSEVEKQPVGWKGTKKHNYLSPRRPERSLHNRIPTPIKMEGGVFIL